jgi:hypothetical protein
MEKARQQAEAMETKRRADNARKAGETADNEFPNEKWKFVEDLEIQFLRSRLQAPNTFINLEKSNLTRREIMSTLYGARNKPDTEESRGYAYYNRFKGGKIILKIKDIKNLIYINVDDLKK